MPAIAEVAAAIAQSLLDPFRRDLAQALDRARGEGLAHEPPQPLVFEAFGGEHDRAIPVGQGRHRNALHIEDRPRPADQPLVIDHFGVAIRGAQRVDPDALLAMIDGGGLGQADDAMLAGGIVGPTDVAGHQSSHRGERTTPALLTAPSKPLPDSDTAAVAPRPDVAPVIRMTLPAKPVMFSPSFAMARSGEGTSQSVECTRQRGGSESASACARARCHNEWTWLARRIVTPRQAYSTPPTFGWTERSP